MFLVSECDDRVFYIKQGNVAFGDTGYMKRDREIHKLKILNCVKRSDNPCKYDRLPEDVLLTMETNCNADTSCEFISAADCYLIAFKDEGAIETPATFDDVIFSLTCLGKNFETVTGVNEAEVECWKNEVYIDNCFYNYLKKLGASYRETKNKFIIGTWESDYLFKKYEVPNRFDSTLPNETVIKISGTGCQYC